MQRIPDQLLAFLQSASEMQFELGAGGIRVFAPGDLRPGQGGYGGHSWSSSWIVVAQDTGSADPFFVDTSLKALPVLTAPHGGGAWKPRRVCQSLGGFAHVLKRLRAMSRNRANPVQLSENPVGESERLEFQRQLDRDGDADSAWWTEYVGGLIDEQ